MNQPSTYLMPPPTRWHYYLLYGPLWLIGKLPIFLLHGLSNIISWVLANVFKYRKNVVYSNLRNAFPNKTEEQIEQIARMYYVHMVDVALETLAIGGMSEKELKKRFVFTNMHLAEDLISKHNILILAMGHSGNWEWGGSSFSARCVYPTYSLYHPLSNNFFNWYMYRLRSTYRINLIPMQQTARVLTKIADTPSLVAFIADQSPVPETAYWTKFLNQDTAFFNGYAKLAVKHHRPVIYASVKKLKRGYYQSTFELIKAADETITAEEITEHYVRLLEKDIKEQPEYWLWSHRRWKHKRPNP